MSNKIIYQNESALLSRTNELNSALDAINNVLTELNSLELIKVKNTVEISELITQKEEFVKNKISDELPVQKWGIFNLKKRHAVDLLELPSFEKLNELCKIAEPYVYDLQYMNFKGGQVIINPDELEKLTENYSVVLKSHAEEKIAEAHSDLAKSIEAMMYIFAINGETKLSQLVNFEENKKVSRKGLFWYQNSKQLTTFRNGE